ncbi:MAG: ComEC/Rec2 family competence protein [Chloroflexota bacterium]
MRLVFIVLGWTAGIIAARHGVTLAPVAWLALAALTLALTLFNWRNPPFRLLNVIALCFVLGGLRYTLYPADSRLALLNDTGGLTVTGVVNAPPDLRDDRTLLRVEAESVNVGDGVDRPISGAVLVRVDRRLSDVRYGDRVRVTGELLTPGVFDTFSYSDYLARRGVFSVMDYASVDVLSGGQGSAFAAALFGLRSRAQDFINKRLPEPQAGLLVGILTGDERGIGPELREDFQATGAAHIIAISGFNMVIVAGVVIGALQQLGPGRRWSPVIAGLVVVFIYALFAGANAAVLRAALMTAVLFIGQALRRNTFTPASLALVALLLSLHNPTVLWDVGFQLSFAAVVGLALFATPIQRRVQALLARVLPPGPASAAAAFLNEPFSVSLAALIAVTPLIIVTFGRFAVPALLVNLLIVPVQAYVLIGGGLALLLFWVPPVATLLLWLVLVLLSWTITVVRGFAALPWADQPLFIHPRWIVLFYLLLLGWAAMDAIKPTWWLRLVRFVRTRTAAGALVFAGAALPLLLGAAYFARPADRLDVWFLANGHSSAVLIQTPDGAQILVDGGRYPSRLLTAIGDRIPFTDRALEVIVITQPDVFDVGALPAVLDRYDAGVVLTNGQPNIGAEYGDLLDALADQQVIVARQGTIIELDSGVTLEVLYPTEPPELADSLDAGPLVLRLRYGDLSVLLPGDLSATGQQALLASGAWPAATVMQLPGHGGAGALDRDFLAAVAPQVIVLQSDPLNRLGDPDPATLDLLPPDVPRYRTDTDGVIHLRSDGKRLWVSR